MNLGDIALEACPHAPMASPAPRQCIRYEAATPQGAWRLQLEFDAAVDDKRGAPHAAAAAAQALLRAEDLLVALDRWCVEAGLEPLPWNWSAAEGPAPGRPEAASAPAGGSERSEHGGSNHGDGGHHGARARWHRDGVEDDVGPTVHVTLGAPWAALHRLGAPPLNLRAALRWDDVWAVCVLDRFVLDADDEARLEPGGAVLIAASLRLPWRGTLRGAGEADDCGLALDLAAAEGGVAIVAMPVDAAAATVAARGATSAGANWEIRSLRPMRVPVAVLCGWVRPEAPWPRALFTELELARCVAGASPRPYMPGSLMPWGRGVAMLLANG
jgi:hypothetical protein